MLCKKEIEWSKSKAVYICTYLHTLQKYGKNILDEIIFVPTYTLLKNGKNILDEIGILVKNWGGGGGLHFFPNECPGLCQLCIDYLEENMK